MSPDRDRLGSSAALAAVGLLAATGAALLFLAGWTVLLPGSACDAIGSHVDGLRSFHLNDGVGADGSEWILVLTEGVPDADREGQVDIARAVRNDPGGYLRFRRALPSDTARVADRLRALALDADRSSSRRADETTRRDAAALATYARARCGLA